jgi:hypothetical protein
MSTFSNTWTSPQPKPIKGSARLERLERRKAVEAEEDANKAQVRRRDQRCRWPHCAFCKRYKNLIPQVAHVVRAKGMGGDPTLVRSQPQHMMLLDPLTHGEQEAHKRDVVPLTDQGTDGPCAFFLIDECGERTLVAEETSIGIYRRD